MPRPVCDVARSAPADAACLGSGSATRTLFTRASDPMHAWLGLPTLAGCGSLPWAVGLRCSPPQPPRQTGGSDLCSRHQRGSSGRFAWCVNRVTRPCWISQVCRQLGRDAGLVALAMVDTNVDAVHGDDASMEPEHEPEPTEPQESHGQAVSHTAWRRVRFRLLTPRTRPG